MILVLDVSAAIAIARGGSHPIDLAEHIVSAHAVESPDLFVSESTNAIWKFHRMGGIEKEECKALLERTLTLPDRFVACMQLRQEALTLAWKLGHSVYDMFYLALARQREAILATLDGKLRKAAHAEGVKTVG